MNNRRKNGRNANGTLPLAIRNKFDELQERLEYLLIIIHSCTMHLPIHLM